MMERKEQMINHIEEIFEKYGKKKLSAELKLTFTPFEKGFKCGSRIYNSFKVEEIGDNFDYNDFIKIKEIVEKLIEKYYAALFDIHMVYLTEKFGHEIKIDVNSKYSTKLEIISDITKIKNTKNDKIIYEIEYTKKIKGTKLITEYQAFNKEIYVNTSGCNVLYSIFDGNLVYSSRILGDEKLGLESKDITGNIIGRNLEEYLREEYYDKLILL